MLIELKYKQGFEKNPFKSNLHPIFRRQHLYTPYFLGEDGILFFSQACLSLFRCCIRPLAILGR